MEEEVAARYEAFRTALAMTIAYLRKDQAAIEAMIAPYRDDPVRLIDGFGRLAQVLAEQLAEHEGMEVVLFLERFAVGMGRDVGESSK